MLTPSAYDKELKNLTVRFFSFKRSRKHFDCPRRSLLKTIFFLSIMCATQKIVIGILKLICHIFCLLHSKKFIIIIHKHLLHVLHCYIFRRSYNFIFAVFSRQFSVSLQLLCVCAA